MTKRKHRSRVLATALMLGVGLMAGDSAVCAAELPETAESAAEVRSEQTPWVEVLADVVVSIGSYITGEELALNKTNRDRIFEFLTGTMELNTAAACGVLANMAEESKFNTDAEGDDGTSRGLCQWHDSRWESLQSWCEENGYEENSLEGQLCYLQYELSENDHRVLYNGRSIYDYLLEIEDTREGAREAARYWCMYYEVPLNRETVAKGRAALAQKTYWPRFSQEP